MIPPGSRGKLGQTSESSVDDTSDHCEAAENSQAREDVPGLRKK